MLLAMARGNIGQKRDFLYSASSVCRQHTLKFFAIFNSMMKVNTFKYQNKKNKNDRYFFDFKTKK
jgi:hypothetical protein